MAYDHALAARVREAVAVRAGVTEKEMFGGVAFLHHGNMFVGVLAPGFADVRDGGLMVRVGPDGGAALRAPHAIELTMRGRPMAGYVVVEPAGVATPGAVAAWIDRAWAFVRTLAPKPGARRPAPAAKQAAAAAAKQAAQRRRGGPRLPVAAAQKARAVAARRAATAKPVAAIARPAVAKPVAAKAVVQPGVAKPAVARPGSAPPTAAAKPTRRRARTDA